MDNKGATEPLGAPGGGPRGGGPPGVILAPVGGPARGMPRGGAPGGGTLLGGPAGAPRGGGPRACKDPSAAGMAPGGPRGGGPRGGGPRGGRLFIAEDGVPGAVAPGGGPRGGGPRGVGAMDDAGGEDQKVVDPEEWRQELLVVVLEVEVLVERQERHQEVALEEEVVLEQVLMEKVHQAVVALQLE
eukprot:gene27342-35312_t